jgi:predicted nucleotidyltransferase
MLSRMHSKLRTFVRELRRVQKGRISRDDATRRIVALLLRLETPTPHLCRVSRVVVYGSYARGAMRVGDVDLAIDYEGGAEMIDRGAIDASVRRLAMTLEAVEAVAPSLAVDERSQARILAADVARLRREMAGGLPVVRAMFDPLRKRPAAGDADAEVDDDQLLRLESELHGAAAAFDDALDARLSFLPNTPSLAPVGNLKRMIAELTGGDERLSIYYHGADTPYDRAVESPGSLWVWQLLWERGDPIELARERFQAIKPDPSAGRAPRSGQTGPGLKA